MGKEPPNSTEEQRHLAALERYYRQQQSSLRAQRRVIDEKLGEFDVKITAIRQLGQPNAEVNPTAEAAIASGASEGPVGPTEAIRDAVRDLSEAFGAKDVFANLQKQQPALAARISRARISVILSKLVARGEISADHGGPGKKSLYAKTATFGLKPGHKPKGETATNLPERSEKKKRLDV